MTRLGSDACATTVKLSIRNAITQMEDALKNKLLVALACTIALSACTTMTLNASNVSIVTASDAKPGDGVKGIKDTFTLDEKVFAYLTFTWADTSARGGRHEVSYRWFSGQKQVKEGKFAFEMGTPPHYAWTSILAVALGTGPGHVDMLVDGQFVGSKSFTVTESKP